MSYMAIGRAGDPGLHAPLLDSMFRLRHDIFHERLRWEVRVENGREHDWFDLIGPRYIIAHDGQANAHGCCRLLPTQGPNMLRDIFPDLLDGAPVPVGEHIWEVSRFAIGEHLARDGYGFSEIPMRIIAAGIRLADRHNVESLVGVTSAAFERLMLHMGVKVERLGRPRRIGSVMSLAFRLPVDANLAVVGPEPRPEVAQAA